MSQEQCLQTVLRYLKQHGMIESMLAVQREAAVQRIPIQMTLESYSKEIAIIRRVMLEGDFTTVRSFLQPFESRLDVRDFRAIMFRIHRQRLFELVEEPDEIELRELLEQDIGNYCTAEQYQQLFDFLTLEHVSEHPDFREWTKLRVNQHPIQGRYDCFEFLKPFIELIESRITARLNEQPSLQMLIQSYFKMLSTVIPTPVKESSMTFSKKPNSHEPALQESQAKQNQSVELSNKFTKSLANDNEKHENTSFQMSSPKEKSVVANLSIAESQNFILSQKFELTERLLTNQSKVSKASSSNRFVRNSEHQQQSKVSEVAGQDELSMSLTPSNVPPSRASTVKQSNRVEKDVILDLDIAKSIKLDASQIQASQLVEEDAPARSISNKQTESNRLVRSSKDPTLEETPFIENSKSAVINIGHPYQEQADEPQPVEFEYNLSRRNPFEKLRRSTKPLLIKLVASVSDEKAMRVCQFSESGRLFAVGTNSSRLKIYDVEGLLEKKHQLNTELQPIYEIPNLHQKSVFSIDWSANEKFMVSCSNDSTVKLTKFDSRMESHQTNVVGRHQASIRMVRFDALLTRILSCAEDHLIKVWDMAKNRSLQVLKGHYSSVNAIRLKETQSSNVVYSVSKDCSIRLWDLRTGEPEAISKPHESEMTYIARHGENLIVSHKDGTVSMYTTSLQLLQNIKVHSQEVRSVECSSDQAYYLSASFDGTTCLMQKDDRQQLKLTYERHNHVKQDDKVVFASFSQSNGYASCSVTGVCNIYGLN